MAVCNRYVNSFRIELFETIRKTFTKCSCKVCKTFLECFYKHTADRFVSIHTMFCSESSVNICKLFTNSLQTLSRMFAESPLSISRAQAFHSRFMAFLKRMNTQETLLELSRTLFKLHSFSPGISDIEPRLISSIFHPVQRLEPPN